MGVRRKNGEQKAKNRGPETGTKEYNFAAIGFRFDILFTLDTIVRAGREIICKPPAVGPAARSTLAWGSWIRDRDQGAEIRGQRSEIRKTLVEVRGLPGLKIETWGTQPCWSYLSHQPEIEVS